MEFEREKEPMHLIDRYRRNLNYLRISITDRCNLRCRYCRPVEETGKLRHEAVLTYEEILRLVRIAVNLGVTKIRLTGGEPLLRRGIDEFIPQLMGIQCLEDVSLTTNGVCLKENLKKIKEGGIKRINISLDTLCKKRFKWITGFDYWQKVWEGIELAREMRFHPIKLNMVVMNGLNADEVLDMAKLSLRYPYYIRFIEYMPVGDLRQSAALHAVPVSWIKNQMNRWGELIPVQKSAHDGPADRYRFEGAPGEIGFISSMSHPFCKTCNRLRLTATGYLRPCLLSNIQEDIKGPMRHGATDDELAGIFLKAAHRKERTHVLNFPPKTGITAQMSAIGG